MNRILLAFGAIGLSAGAHADTTPTAITPIANGTQSAATAPAASAAPAGVKFENTGHHHLLVDTDLADLKLDAPLPATDKILHFGKGQTETALNLAPGVHTLQLLFADYAHRSFDPPLHSSKITITVD